MVVHVARYEFAVSGSGYNKNTTLTLEGTNTYIIGTGAQRLLLDTGEGRPSWIKAVREVLTSENVFLSKALISHWHMDHVGGIDQLLEIYPGVKIHKHQPSEGQLDIHDGEKFAVDGATLRAVHSPGHTQDHMVFILEEEDAMFTADNVLGQGTAVFEDLSSYLKSLAKMSGLFEGRAYPGHGPVIEEGKAKILEYIRHRQQREDQVLEVLRSPQPDAAQKGHATDEWTSMEMVKVIYKDFPESLHLPAEGGILQVLWKLVAEDKVIENTNTGRWRIKDRATL